MKAVLFLLYVGMLLSQAIVCYLQPYHNWDMLGYMGSVISLREENIDSIHTQTYRAAQLELPKKDFVTLTESGEYRRKNFSDAEFFHEQLKLYLVKPLYVFFVFLLWKIGFTLSLSTLIPSLCSTIFIGLLFHFWMQKHMSNIHATILCGLIMLSPPLWEVGRYSTPDALAGFVALSAFYFLVEKKNFSAFSALMLAGILIRIDLGLLALIILIWMFFFGNTFFSVPKRILFTSAIAVMVLVTGELIFAGNKGESLTVFYNFGLDKSDVSHNYFRKLADLFPQLRYSAFTIFAAVTLMILFFTKSFSEWKTNFYEQLIMLVLGYVIIRCIIFPSLEDRFFISEYLLLVTLSVGCFLETKKESA